MSNKAILQERADALEKELKGLRGEISAMPDDKWVPKVGEVYWFVNGCGDVIDRYGCGSSVDQSRLAYNNVFPTKEKAEQARDVIKGMCWDEFPVNGTSIEWLLSSGSWVADTWRGYPSQQAMFRMGTLRVKK